MHESAEHDIKLMETSNLSRVTKVAKKIKE
jgi:hypothetical protein